MVCFARVAVSVAIGILSVQGTVGELDTPPEEKTMSADLPMPRPVDDAADSPTAVKREAPIKVHDAEDAEKEEEEVEGPGDNSSENIGSPDEAAEDVALLDEDDDEDEMIGARDTSSSINGQSSLSVSEDGEPADSTSAVVAEIDSDAEQATREGQSADSLLTDSNTLEENSSHENLPTDDALSADSSTPTPAASEDVKFSVERFESTSSTQVSDSNPEAEEAEVTKLTDAAQRLAKAHLAQSPPENDD